MNDPDIFKNPCAICNKKKATRLCDYIIGYMGVSYYRNYLDFKNQQPLNITCDTPLCDDCSQKNERLDYCPKHSMQ